MYHHPAHGWSEVIHNLAIRKASIEETWGWGITWDGGRSVESQRCSMRTLIFEALGCGFKTSEKFVSVITMIIIVVKMPWVKSERNGWLHIVEER